MRWEYKTITVDVTSGMLSMGGHFDQNALTEVLNRDGRESWELVLDFDTNMRADSNRSMVLILKRPLEKS
jgi:hypothetical protein